MSSTGQRLDSDVYEVGINGNDVPTKNAAYRRGQVRCPGRGPCWGTIGTDVPSRVGEPVSAAFGSSVVHCSSGSALSCVVIG